MEGGNTQFPVIVLRSSNRLNMQRLQLYNNTRDINNQDAGDFSFNLTGSQTWKPKRMSTEDSSSVYLVIHNERRLPIY